VKRRVQTGGGGKMNVHVDINEADVETGRDQRTDKKEKENETDHRQADKSKKEHGDMYTVKPKRQQEHSSFGVQQRGQAHISIL